MVATRDRQASLLIHVDDVYGSGLRERLKQITSAVSSRYKCSIKWLVEPGDCISFLKRSYELVGDGEEQLLVIRPHPRHVERRVKMLNLESRKCKATPMPSSLHPDHEPLSSDDASLFRSATGILLYLGPDTAESQNAIRLLAQQMANPTRSGMHLLKHVVCYLKSVTGYGLAFNVPTIGSGIVTRDKSQDVLELFSDADWSADRQTRRSISSAVLAFNGHVLATSSRTQKSVSLSSCESEYGAYVSGLCDLIYVSNAIEFCLGKPILRCTYIDSTSAKSLVTRQGVGRTRHLDGKLLWVQERARDNYMTISGINTLRNIADTGTKALSRERILCLLYLLCVVDCDNKCSRVGVSEHSEMESKLAVKLQVRRLQQRVAHATQKTVLAQALRIAVVLNLADALSPSMSPILEGVRVWSAVRVILLVIVSMLCAVLLQGCDDDGNNVLQVQFELWFYEAIAVLVEHPWASASIAGFLVAAPWTILLLQCCACNRVHGVTLKGKHQTAKEDPSADAHDHETCDSPKPDVPCGSGDNPADPRPASSSSSSCVQQEPASSNVHAEHASPDAKKSGAAKPRSKARPGVAIAPNETIVYVTCRKGKCFHVKRGCTGLNGADNIDRIGLAEARVRGYTACRICAKSHL